MCIIQAIIGLRNDLKLPAAAVQIPIGLEGDFEGIILHNIFHFMHIILLIS